MKCNRYPASDPDGRYGHAWVAHIVAVLVPATFLGLLLLFK